MDILEQNQQLKISKLQYIVHHAKTNSPLYKEKYNTYNIAQNFLTTFQQLPFLSRTEYYQGMKPPHFSLLTDSLSNCYIFTSGGTTGDVKLTAWEQNFVQNWCQECFESLTAVGLSEHDIVVNLFFPGIWATHALINKALEKANCRILPLGGKGKLEQLIEYLRRFLINTVIGVPSFIVRMAEYIASLPYNIQQDIHVRKIFHSGEFLSERQTKYLQDILHCTHISPFLYSSTDTGTIGIKCSQCNYNQYHLVDSMYLEVLNMDLQEPARIGQPGEFIATSLVNTKAPCVRYRVGDQGIIESTICPCGQTTPLFTLLGRADDEVKVAGYLISPDIIQRTLEQFPQLSRNFQLIIEEQEQKTKMTVACELLHNATADATLPLTIAQHLLKEYDILGTLVQQKYCYIPQIQLFSPDSLPRNPQTGKIKRVIVR